MSGDDKPTVFISYSHKDKDWKDHLVTHLRVSQKQQLLHVWEDKLIGTGEDWYQKIQDAMNAASAAVLLVSANSLTSDFILDEEVKRLLQRREAEGLCIFPVIIKPCDWEAVDWLRRMKVRPEDGRPLSGGSDFQIDTDLTAIAKEIRLLLNSKPPATNTSRRAPLDPKNISTGRLPVTGRELFGRDEELRQLDAAWADPGTNVLSLVAWGGVGKSALVNHWLAQSAREDYRGAERVYGWSFYSQGTTDRAASADQFIEAALTWFGDPDPNRGSPWDKGERLAGLVARRRALLVLDGLEPLQHPPGPDEGRLKDQALQSLLRSLAASNQGLCVISTRIAVADLGPFEGSTHTRIDLDYLSPEAGAQVLRAQGATGAEDELRKASEEFGGHSLALTLLGSYLADVYGGDVRRRGEVGDLEADVRHGGHAQRVMVSYEKWFGEGPELAVLRLLGLFNRLADKGSIDALRAAPAIPNLTEPLQGLSEPDWQRTLSKLRRARLLAAPSTNQSGTLDTHPLVREHFGHQLKRTRPDAWREGNSRLYDHLTRTTKEFPDSLEEMAPLFAAIAHGCEAGRHQETLDEVYKRRIQRGGEYFSVRTLGAPSADLTALRSFFDSPWKQPVTGLTETLKAYVLAMAGAILHSLGRLEESIQPVQASLDACITHKDWANAAIVAVNLSETYLTIGDLPKALLSAQQSVKLSEETSDVFTQVISKTTLASTLHQIDRLSDSENAFREAEKKQEELWPNFPILFSLRGFQYCELLLDQGKYQEVLRRAEQALAWVVPLGYHLDIAHDCISMGRAYLVRTRREGSINFTEATGYLRRAVNELRQAGVLDELPRGLTARAELYRVTDEFELAQADLDEAMGIATRGSMGLHEADCHLEYARLYLARGEGELARASWAKAKEMIERMGYGRRDKDVREIDEQLKAAGV